MHVERTEVVAVHDCDDAAQARFGTLEHPGSLSGVVDVRRDRHDLGVLVAVQDSCQRRRSWRRHDHAYAIGQ